MLTQGLWDSRWNSKYDILFINVTWGDDVRACIN